MITLLMLLACGGPASTPEAPVAQAPAAAPVEAAAPAEARPDAATPGLVLGGAFEPGTPINAEALVAAAENYNGKDVVVEGTIQEVCQKKGCWHTIATANPDVALMVKDKEYQIFLPKDAAGKAVLVHGNFAVVEMPEDEARHYAEDAGKDPTTIVGSQKRFTLDVAGVRFL